MKAKDVKVGGLYRAKVSGGVTKVRIDREAGEVETGSPEFPRWRHGGWHATNMATGRQVRIRTASRLRGPADLEQRLAGRRSRLLTAEEKGLRAEAAANRGGPGLDDEITYDERSRQTTFDEWSRRHERAEDDYGGVLGADGQVYSDADPGL
jgi:hypothetical protein